MLLSFSVGKDTTHLFVLDPSGTLQVKTLAVGEAALRDEVRRFRTLVARGRFGTAETEGVGERGRQLYDLLLAPAEETLGQSERLLVIPDGPLHLLPFAALVRRTEATGESSRPWQYLVEWRPIHVAVSATVYDELRRRRGGRSGPGAGGVLVAFGDPKYPSAAQDRVADAAVSAALGSGRSLAPLPATRGEVLGIAGVYGDRSRVYLGEEATEERAKSLTGEVAYLHFATHGLLDERLPLDSALALTIPAAPAEGQENGLLQAWEVFERVRLDADLVVLSGCETALGGEVAGEGLIGLTRAFQYAGARSVLASLWSVADESTAELMRRFYGHLKEGASTDEALRQAQLELLRGPLEVVDAKGQKVRLDATHPFFWAAFELIGDWR